MGLLRLNRVNRLLLVAWTVGIVAVALRVPGAVPAVAVPTPGPLANLSPEQVRYGTLALMWATGVLLVLAWQRTLWTTMGVGAGLTTDGAVGFALPPIQGTVRERIVTASAVRRGWSPLARLRVETSIDVRDPPVRLELAITTASDPEGRVLFEAPDGDRRYVLRDGDGDLEAVLATDYRAELLDVETQGVLRVDGSHASYELPYVPFDAGQLRTCAQTTVRLAEQVEKVAGDRRGT